MPRCRERLLDVVEPLDDRPEQQDDTDAGDDAALGIFRNTLAKPIIFSTTLPARHSGDDLLLQQLVEPEPRAKPKAMAKPAHR